MEKNSKKKKKKKNFAFLKKSPYLLNDNRS